MTTESRNNAAPEPVNEPKKELRKRKALPVKVFQTRESLLTVLYENPHVKVVKHIFVAALVVLFVNTVVHDYFENGEVKLGFGLIYRSFGKLHLVAVIWLIQNICAILCYYCFNSWANIRIQMPPKGKPTKLLDMIFFCTVPVYYTLQFRAISLIVTYLNMPIASKAILCIEQVRILMKTHSYIRENYSKVISYDPHSYTTWKLASLSHFIYFLGVPTIVYRDEYPRRQNIRWNLIHAWCLEFVGGIFYYAFLVERFIIPNFKNMGLKQHTTSELFIIMCDLGTVGLFFLLISFYLILHVVQNLVGELLMFGDREFYRAWWTSTNYSDYFRTWNIVVSDWLYTYIYKDCYEFVVPGNKTVAKLAVFLISAIVHEWILTYMFGFFFPALFLVFLFTGSCLTHLKTPNLGIVNVLFWYVLALGSGWLVSLYSMEYFVRENVPLVNSTIENFIIPRLFTCNCIV